MGNPTNTTAANATPKPAHQSLTVVVNTLVALGSLAVFIDPSMITSFVNAHIGNQEVAVALSGLGVAALGLINVLIRVYKTKQPIS